LSEGMLVFEDLAAAVKGDAAVRLLRMLIFEDWQMRGILKVQLKSICLCIQVHLLPFGSGLPAVAELLQDGVFSSSNPHLEERMELMACVVEAVTDEGSAADHARAVLQSPSGPSALLEQRDDVGRTALHLAAAQGRRLLVTALLSGPKETRKAAACARDLRGRTPLHYCTGEHVAMTLLQAHADPSLVDEQGCGPLHVNRDPNVADRLVKAKTHGAPNDASPDLRDKVRSLRLSKPSPSTSCPSVPSPMRNRVATNGCL
jgi:hypothetical protein